MWANGKCFFFVRAQRIGCVSDRGGYMKLVRFEEMNEFNRNRPSAQNLCGNFLIVTHVNACAVLTPAKNTYIFSPSPLCDRSTGLCVRETLPTQHTVKMSQKIHSLQWILIWESVKTSVRKCDRCIRDPSSVRPRDAVIRQIRWFQCRLPSHGVSVSRRL